MAPLPIQLDDALATASPEVRASLVMGFEDSPDERLAEDWEPSPWPGAVHEVFAAPAGGESGRFATNHPVPAGMLIGWALRKRGRLAVWVGRRVWPYPPVLERAGLLCGSLFVDAADNDQRLWAAELSLRSSAVSSVIVDGSGLGMSATRRLQLASRASEALLLVARPSQDERRLSASGVRWRVGAVPARGECPQWKVELLRCKGVRPASLGFHGHSHPAWRFRWDAESASTRFVGTDVDHDERDEHPARPGSAVCAPRPKGVAALSGGLPADLAGRPDPEAPVAPARRTG